MLRKTEATMVTPSGLLKQLFYLFLSPVVDPYLLSGLKQTSVMTAQALTGNLCTLPYILWRFLVPIKAGAKADWFPD